MDTDFLSNEAYNLICMAASFDDTLKALMGASCSEHESEDACYLTRGYSRRKNPRLEGPFTKTEQEAERFG